MATNTTNYNLVKQNENENYDVNVVNANLDKIDTEIKKANNKFDTISLTSDKVTRPNGKTVEASLVANETSISNLQTELGVNKTTLEANINAIRTVL